ncbi:10341_t:CDS:2 [Cetraspora pellucida]|uniref:10341_t:CDS:1 n=1 Tax=Cetraspora pellucida TaxID=1433469 RepID=A0A9N9EFU7_9GLOM|nr:10341_t:CDS:2 [Cetraspora pellucida]
MNVIVVDADRLRELEYCSRSSDAIIFLSSKNQDANIYNEKTITA